MTETTPRPRRNCVEPLLQVTLCMRVARADGDVVHSLASNSPLPRKKTSCTASPQDAADVRSVDLLGGGDFLEDRKYAALWGPWERQLSRNPDVARPSSGRGNFDPKRSFDDY